MRELHARALDAVPVVVADAPDDLAVLLLADFPARCSGIDDGEAAFLLSFAKGALRTWGPVKES